MDVSIIIVNYHSADLVIDCINSVFKQTKKLSYEIVVVDNASGDGSIEKLTNYYGNKIKVIASEENLGFGKANNLGVKFATGEYVFFLNPDTILVNDAMQILIDYLEHNKAVGIAGGNLYTPDMTACPSYCIEFDDIKTEMKRSSWTYLIASKVSRKMKNRRKSSVENLRPFSENFNYSGKEKKVAYIFGADMLMKRTLFLEMKGFDPAFFMYSEEQELSWRVTQAGYDVVSVPSAKIIHLEGVTSKAANTFSERHFKMRMTGILTYFNKRFGKKGVDEFFKYRSRRYQRLITIARLQHKETTHSDAAIQLRCLKEIHQEFMSNLS